MINNKTDWAYCIKNHLEYGGDISIAVQFFKGELYRIVKENMNCIYICNEEYNETLRFSHKEFLTIFKYAEDFEIKANLYMGK